MKGSAIRELSIAQKAGIVAAAFDSKIIQIWCLSTFRQIAEIPTIFEFGAAGLAMQPGGLIVMAGKSAKSGEIAAYNIPSGKVLWNRKKISYPTWFKVGPSGNDFWFSSGDGAGQVDNLDIYSGSSIRHLSKTRQYFPGPNGRAFVDPSYKLSNYILTGTPPVAVKKLSFAVLDVCFTPDGVALTEAGGPLRYVRYSDGAEIWKLQPEPDSHFLKLHFSPKDECIYGVLRHLEEPIYRHLIRFELHSGAQHMVCDISGSWAEAFVAETDQLITSSGRVVNLLTGLDVGRLEFPEIDYPDDPFDFLRELE